MTEPPFTTGCGRRVYLERLDIRKTTLGILEGSAETIRVEVLQCIPEEVRKKYGQTGLFLHEVQSGGLLAFTYFMQLHSYSALTPGGDFSSLVVVWFADSLPANLDAEVAAQVHSIEWELHAVDGKY